MLQVYQTEKVEIGVIMHKNRFFSCYYISYYLTLWNIILSYISNFAGVPDKEGGDRCNHAQELLLLILFHIMLSDSIKYYLVLSFQCCRCTPQRRVEIGVIMHKNCFKCIKCSVTLTLNSFVLARSVEGGPKDVFCKVLYHISAHRLFLWMFLLLNSLTYVVFTHKNDYNWTLTRNLTFVLGVE